MAIKPAKLYFKCAYNNQSYIFIAVDTRNTINPINEYLRSFDEAAESKLIAERADIDSTYDAISKKLKVDYPAAKIYCCGEESSYLSNNDSFKEVYLHENNSTTIFKKIFFAFINQNYPLSSIFVNKLKANGFEIDSMSTNLWFQHRYISYLITLYDRVLFFFYLNCSGKNLNELIFRKFNVHLFTPHFFNLLKLNFNFPRELLSFVSNLVSPALSSLFKNPILNLKNFIIFNIAQLTAVKIINSGINWFFKKIISHFDDCMNFIQDKEKQSLENHALNLKTQTYGKDSSIVPALSKFSDADLTSLQSSINKHIKSNIENDIPIPTESSNLFERILNIKFENISEVSFNSDEIAVLKDVLRNYPSLPTIIEGYEEANEGVLGALESISFFGWYKSHYARKIKNIIEENDSRSTSEKTPLIFLINDEYLNGVNSNGLLQQLEKNLEGFKIA